MIDVNSPVVVLGAGSIGERHIKVLLELGYTNIHVYRKRNLPLRTISSTAINIFTDIADVDSIKPVAAFVTSPTALHMEQAIYCAGKGIHTLIEKPLSNKLDRFDELKQVANQNNVLVQVAYMLRFHPAFLRIKAIIDSKQYGQLLYFHTHWGEYLPDWHPWEDYRESYAALDELGGGAALTLSHDIDITSWLLNEDMLSYKATANTKPHLEVNVESAADFICSYKSGTTGHIHLNFFQKIPLRTYQFVFEKALVQYNYFKNLLTVETAEESFTIDMQGFQRDDMFKDQTSHFFDTINKIDNYSVITNKYLDESENIIRMCLALKN